MLPLVENGFIIRILEQENGYKVKAESPLGSTEHFLKVDFQDLTYYFKLRKLRESLQLNYLIDKRLPKGYIKKFGKELFETLFRDEMKELFRKCFKQCVKEGNPLRILLESDSSEVHQIPWEVMYFEEERLFMGNSSYVTFSRSISDSLEIDLDLVKPPLKLLVLVSNPLNLPDEDYEIDIREIERLIGVPLKDLESQGWITTEFTDDTRFNQVRKQLKEGWNIIHFVGHGSYDGQKTSILIEDDNRNHFGLSADKVPELFESEKRPNLILFSACESAQVPVDIYSGIPFILLKRGFPAVIAMQYSVLVGAADNFVKYLYENLGKTPIDKAVSEARMAIYQKYREDNISWFTPVLYVSGLNTILEFEAGAVSHPPQKKRVDFLMDLPSAEIFFGRKKHRLEIEEAFFEERRKVVLLNGIGGIGKSSLAREFADRLEKKYKAAFSKKVTSDFSLKAFFEEIGEFLAANGDTSFKKIVDNDKSIRAKLEHLCKSLDLNRYLIILDGFEVVMKDMKVKSEDMRHLLKAFVNGDHKSNVILTSRFLLDEYEIKTVDLGDLSIKSCQRILNAKDVSLYPKEMELVYERMGGNPEYYNLLSPLIKRVGKENLLEAMKEARKEIDEWLLDELFGLLSTEKEVLKKVSVFRIPFERKALKLAGATNEMVETLLGLSLLKLDDFYSVHSLVKDYCCDRMTKKEKESAHELAIEYYEQEKLNFQGLLELHHHLLKARKFEEAAHIVLKNTEGLTMKGHLKLAFDLNISASWGTSQETKSSSYRNLGIIHHRRGEYGKSLKYFKKSLKIKEKIKDLEGISAIYHNLGIIYQYWDYEEALEYFNKSLEIKEKFDDKRGIGKTYHELGMIYQYKGEFEKALEYFNKSLEIKEKFDDKRGIGKTYNQIGMVHHSIAVIYGQHNLIFQELKELTKAQQYLYKSLEIFREIEDVSGIAIVYRCLGVVDFSRGVYGDAVGWLEKSLEISEALFDLEGIASVHYYFGLIYKKNEKYDESEKSFKKSLSIFEKIHHIGGTADTCKQLGALYFEMEEYEIALKYFLSALDMFYSIQSSEANLIEECIKETRHRLGEE